MKIPFDSFILRAVIHELAQILCGGVVQHISQPSETDLILTVRNRGENHSLLISIDTNFARIHLVHSKRANPPTPPSFCMLCRKYVEGLRIAAMTQRNFDRICDIELASSSGARYFLMAELMGKHSNLSLVDEGGIILDSMKHISHRLSRHREMLPGKPYVEPPTNPDKISPWKLDANTLQESFNNEIPTKDQLLDRFEGMSPFLANEIVIRSASAGIGSVWQELFSSALATRYSPTVIRDHSQLGERYIGAYPVPSVQFTADSLHARSSMNMALEHYYSSAIANFKFDNLKHELTSTLKKELAYKDKQRNSLLRSLEEAGRADDYMKNGNLILANAHSIQPGAESVIVPDYFSEGSPDCTIPLDIKLNARENADAYFKRYRKSRDGALRHKEFLETVEAELVTIKSLLSQIEMAPNVDALSELRTEINGTGLLRQSSSSETASKPAPDYQGKKIRTHRTPDGWEILYGDNSEANDFLTAKVASPNDIWLHVRSNSSAHVVIRTKNSPQSVPKSILERAALIAAKHSAAKHSSVVPVDWTLKKYVRRPRGSASGAATYQNERTIYVNPKDD